MTENKMVTPKFEGWFGFDKETGVGGMKWQEFEPKKFEDDDVEIKISHCGKEYLDSIRAPIS